MGNLDFTGPYMPPGDKDFYDWLENFAALLTENPGRYGLGKTDATVIENHWCSYEVAYKRAKHPRTRTTTSIQHKDAVKASAMASLRVYCGQIRACMGVPDDALVDLGLNPRSNSRSPVPQPQSAPIVMAICGYPCVTALRYADENTPASRRKPPGVMALQLAVAVTTPGDPTPVSADEAQQRDLFTKQPILFKHDEMDAGKIATFFGRWVTGRGLVGPWSLPTHFTICAGGSSIPKELRDQMRVPEMDAMEKKRRKAA